MPNVYYDKILGRLRDAGLSDNSAVEIALILSELVESSEGNELNTSRAEITLNDILEEQRLTNKLLKKIYNPE